MKKTINACVGITCEMKVKTRIVSAIDIEQVKDGRGIILKESPWRKNLILDQGLNAIAGQTSVSMQSNPAAIFQYCQVGSGTNPVKTSSGAITFTQSGTTITASGGFFTAGMVGSLFKYGTGTAGAEYYITAFTDSTHVTVDTSATVAVPEVGVVWGVNQTALQTFLYQSNTYQTSTGDNFTDKTTSPVVTMQRTFVFPVQASPYNVNEIGWSSIPGGSRCAGRLVLSSTDVVAPTNFYVVVLQMSYTYSPSAPTAVGDVGINIDTSGNAMFETLKYISVVNTNGSVTVSYSDRGNGNINSENKLVFPTATYTQNGSVANPGSLQWATNKSILTTVNGVYASVRGKMTWSYASSITTAGETAYGMGLCNGGGTPEPWFDVKFTTPFVLPTGTFLPTTVFSVVYNRLLNN